MIDSSALPTPLAVVVRRLNVCGPENSADTFLYASYVAEVAIKMLGVGLVAGLKERAPDHAYRLAHDYVRADGLGVWEDGIRQCTSQPLVGFLDRRLMEIVSWATKKRSGEGNEWYTAAAKDLEYLFELLGLESYIPTKKPTVQHLLTALVQLRNKTKAHGAAGEDFWNPANDRWVSAVEGFVTHCPLFGWPWIHLPTRESGKVRGVWLTGTDPKHAKKNELEEITAPETGVFFKPSALGQPIPCGTLLHANRECTEFLLPNGGYSAKGRASFLDYGAGFEKKIDAKEYLRPPVAAPPSTTQGLSALVVQSNTLGNLPDLQKDYVLRPKLEDELETRLRDRNHPIVTLHGRGGIGKTSLALQVAHHLAEPFETLFDEIIWFSARDVDLLIHGARNVKPSVVSLDDIASTYGKLMGADQSIEGLALALQSADPLTRKGRLLIFDNFETMSDMKGVHEFLDTHTHLPNKVLITSRERAFKADFPIEVQGMEWEEADKLMRGVAEALDAIGLLTTEAANRFYDFTEGHPYVLRILVGELAKESRYVPPRTLMPRRSDILDAVFQRSFQKLSEAGKWVFLLTGNWNSAIAETGLLVILGQRDLDAEEGLEECVRLSLITRVEFPDGQPAYLAPQVARLFGKKKLAGDPDRLAIQEDLDLVRQFGVLPTGEPIGVPEDAVLARFAKWALEQVRRGGKDTVRLDRTVELLSEVWPQAWTTLAAIRQERCAHADDVDYALRRAVEDAPTDPSVWRARANFALQQGDDSTYIASRIRSAELEPDDVHLVRDVAGNVSAYITKHKEIPVARRSVYLASVRGLMLRLSKELDATGLSRLAWLFLLEENKADAWKWAEAGLAMKKNNDYCLKIIERLQGQGYYGPLS